MNAKLVYKQTLSETNSFIDSFSLLFVILLSKNIEMNGSFKLKGFYFNWENKKRMA